MDGVATQRFPEGLEDLSQNPRPVGSATRNPNADEKPPVIAIQFRRDPRTTGGPGECAWCEVDGQRFEIPPKEKGRNGGAVYRLIVMLASTGYEGRPFETHDGRMVCLRGAIDLQSVPVNYGGKQKSRTPLEGDG